MYRSGFTLLLMAGALAVGLAPPARASYAQDAIAALNAQREANGIPGAITENPDWSRGCELHMAYLALNRVTGHDEDPAQPGYTDAGAAAGGSSVLSYGGADWPANPWEHAPIHLAQVMHPALSQTGAAPGCLTTWPGYDRPEPDETVVYTYPGPGRTDVPAQESTDESPFTPAELLGLPNPTGPHLYVFPFGGDGDGVAAAQLTGPDGPVDIRVADSKTSDGSRTIGGYIPRRTALLIPVAPLRPDSAYTAGVTMASGRVHTWSFRTAPRENSVDVALGADDLGRLAVDVTSTAPGVRVWSVDPAARTATVATNAAPADDGEPATAHTGTVGGRPGLWRVCAASGGAGTGYTAAERCASARLKARWAVSLTRNGRRLTVRAHDYTVGRTVTIVARRAKHRCSGRGAARQCGDVLTGTTFRRTVRPGPSATLTLPAWAKGQRSRVWVEARVTRGRAFGASVPALKVNQRVDSAKPTRTR